MLTTGYFDKNVVKNLQFTPKCSPDVSSVVVVVVCVCQGVGGGVINIEVLKSETKLITSSQPPSSNPGSDLLMENLENYFGLQIQSPQSNPPHPN